jgi:hypothetical protein
MQGNEQNTATRAVVRTFPTARNRGELTLRELCDAYMAGYTGRDKANKPVLREHGQRSPATVNQYRQALPAVLTWAMQSAAVTRSKKRVVAGCETRE